MECLYHTSFPRGSGLQAEEGDRTIVRARVGEWLQANIAFQTHQGRCSYELRDIVTACMRTVEIQARQNLAHRLGRWA